MFNPPNLSGPLHQDVRYKELAKLLSEAGCFVPAHLKYAVRIAWITGAVMIAFVVLLFAPSWPPRLALIALLSICCVQASFVAHDVGDGALTKNKRVSSGLRHVLLTFFSGVSSTYFHHLHRLHHLSLDRRGKTGGGGRYLTNKYELHWLKHVLAANGLMFMVGTIVLRGLTFRIESLRFVFANPLSTKTDRLFLLGHYLVWFAFPALLIGPVSAILNLALLTLFAGAYIGTVLVLNHEGMSRVDEVANLPPFDRVLATTRNLSPSAVADVTLGGVNNHIEHHMFPDMPTMHLARARKIMREFCKSRALPYAETNLTEAVLGAARHFRNSPRERLTQEVLS